jgi:hypothetical protein
MKDELEHLTQDEINQLIALLYRLHNQLDMDNMEGLRLTSELIEWLNNN